MAALSVIICTHNPRRPLLSRALEGLRLQTLPAALWELLLVDNASAEPVEGAVDLGWHPASRVVREDELGLTAARIRGIHETRGDLLVFVDDDNVLREDYLATVVQIADTHPMLGCFGAGVIRPEFEVPPPDEVRPHTRLLALREVTRTTWSNDPGDGLFPWGPGLVVRRPVADQFAAVVRADGLTSAIGRRGASLASGEDEVFGWLALGAGLGKGVFRELETLHVIPRERIDFDYLLRLHRAQARSFALIHQWQGRPVAIPQAPARPADVVRHLRRGDMAAACQAAASYLVHRRMDRHTALMDEAWRRGIEDHVTGQGST